MSKQRLLLPCLAAVGLLFGAAACGDDSDDGSGIATADGSEAEGESASGDGGGSDASPEETQDAMIDYAECMRENGIDMPDPQVDGDGRVTMEALPAEGGGGEGPPDEDSDFEAADEECKHLIEDVVGERQEPSPEEEAEMQDKFTEMAECMRDRGHDMPDPEVDGGGVIISRDEEDGGEPPEEDPEFESDMEECSEEAGVEGPGGRATTREED